MPCPTESFLKVNVNELVKSVLWYPFKEIFGYQKCIFIRKSKVASSDSRRHYWNGLMVNFYNLIIWYTSETLDSTTSHHNLPPLPVLWISIRPNKVTWVIGILVICLPLNDPELKYRKLTFGVFGLTVERLPNGQINLRKGFWCSTSCLFPTTTINDKPFIVSFIWLRQFMAS